MECDFLSMFGPQEVCENQMYGLTGEGVALLKEVKHCVLQWIQGFVASGNFHTWTA